MKKRTSSVILIIVLLITLTLFATACDNDSYKINFYDGDIVYETVTTGGKEKITIPVDPTKSGYTFGGWYLEKEFTTELKDDTYAKTKLTAEVNVYAKWTANDNTVIFNANGGTGEMSNLIIKTDSAANLTANAFVKAGYTFAGWATSANGEVLYADSVNYKMGASGITLFAKWTANDNTVTFYANNGTTSKTTQTIKTDAVANLTANTFTMEGYTFAGWALTADGDAIYSDGASYTMGAGSVTLFGAWTANNNTLTFNANGGTGAMTALIVKTGEVVTLTTNIFTKAGCSFAGWSIVENGVKVHNDGARYRMGASDAGLYAVWTANDNTIVFNSNGGTGEMANIVSTMGERVTFTLNTFEKAGYTFAGWATISGGEKVYNDGMDYTMGENGITLFAVWTANNNTITFNKNDGTDAKSTQTINTDATANLTSNAFTKDGYTFAGWALTADGEAKYADGVSYTMGVANIELFAKWTANDNTLTFNANGGTNEMASLTVKTDEAVTLTANAFAREGYTFAGWATSATGAKEIDNNASYTMGTANVELFAVWIGNDNTITFLASNGTGEKSTQIIKTGVTANLTVNPFTYEGYTFAGWSTTAIREVAYTDGAPYTMGTASVELLAVWMANSYTITFNANGGTGATTTQMVKMGEQVTLMDNPFTKDGYDLIGWSIVADGEVKYFDGEKFRMQAGDLELFAVWKAKNNTVIFNANGGTGNMANLVITMGETANLTRNDFAKGGYTFAGWALAATGEVVYTDGVNYTMGADGITLFAKWTANDNTITFNANGGKGAMTALTVKTDVEVTLTDNAFTKDGYTFMGWAITADGIKEYQNNETHVTVSKNLELFAVWQANANVIMYYPNGGTGNMSGDTVQTDAEVTLKKNTFTKKGYTFAGWATSETGNVVRADGVTFKMGTSDLDLYAKWTANANTITFNANGGTGAMTAQTINTDASANLTANGFTKDGYTFAGWAKSATGAKEIDNNASYTMGVASVELFAKWTANDNTVTFYANNGTTSKTTQTIKTDASANLTANGFTKWSYTFVGWATTVNGEVAYNDKANFTMGVANVDLYAKWTGNIYEVTFDANGGTGSIGSVLATYEHQMPILSGVAPTRSGYTFAGFADGAIGGTKYYNADLTSAKIFDKTGTTTLFAMWIGTITFNANGGTGAMNNMLVEASATVNLTDIGFTKTGYTFIGWATSASGAKAYNNVASYAMNNGNATLYAIWTINTYTVELDYNSVQTIPGVRSMTITYNTAFTCPAPSLMGYIFQGWYNGETPCTDNNGKSIVVYKGANGEKYTFTARWESVYGNMEFENIGNNAIKLKKYTGKARYFVTPDNQRGLPVTTIGYQAFKNCESLISIKIAAETINIEAYAFLGCTSLTSVTFEEGSQIQKIGCKAFMWTYSLKKFNIPKTVTDLGLYDSGDRYSAFTDSSVEELTADPTSNTFYVQRDCLIQVSGATQRLIFGTLKIKAIEKYEMPAYVTEINPYAFAGNTTLTTIYIPDYITKIGWKVFDGCTNLKTIKCQVASKPADWDNTWLGDCKAKVEWSATR